VAWRAQELPERLVKRAEVAARHLPQDSTVDRACPREDVLVETAKLKRSFELRTCLADLYLGGYFGAHDAISGYAWTLAAWNCSESSYDDKFNLAEAQQYYEFFLSESGRTDALRLLDGLLSNAEARDYVPGNPFNGGWWGWEDDPIPARPGERDFKEHFVLWLQLSGHSSGEISEILDRCPPSDGPTRKERIEGQVEEDMRNRGFTKDVSTPPT
jgi:hypothetical protein